MAHVCSICGYENDADANVCELCNTALGAPAFVPPPADDRAEDRPDPQPPIGSFGQPGGGPPKLHTTDLGITGEALRRSENDLAAVHEHNPDLPPDVTPVPVLPGPRSDLDVGRGRIAIVHAGRRPADNEPHPLLGRIKLVVEQGQIIGEQYLLTEPRMLVGRIDPEAGIYPDIDLSAQDPEYVHRQHARLQFHDYATRLSVEHLGGHNRTLVNNDPIDAGELYELRPGDRLRVGRVVMRLTSVVQGE